MSVYVDDMLMPATVGNCRPARWSHLQADTLDELHEFAQRLGLRREWFQPGSRPEAAHYDVTATKRAEAIKLGAISETMREGSVRRNRLRTERLGRVSRDD